MKCTNKEQEQEFISEALRILKKEYETPTYEDLDIDTREDYIQLRLYQYENVNSRRYIINFTITKSNSIRVLTINNFGPISMDLTEDQFIDFTYLINLFKKQYLEKVLSSLKAK